MLCTFTTEYGDLIIRSEDIRRIADIDDPDQQKQAFSLLIWAEGDECESDHVLGTAAENRNRIQQEELDLIARVEAHRYETQRRLSEGYPVPSVTRGKQVR